MAILGVYLTNSVRNAQLSSLHSQLENEAKVTAEASLLGFVGQDEENNLDILAKKLGNQIGARVTIIAIDGTVLCDSQEEPSATENHATRPEVRDALASGFNESTRYSTTLEKKMMKLTISITRSLGNCLL